MMTPANPLQVTWGEDKYKVSITVDCFGEDLMVSVQGGIRHHIGAVALAVPRPSLVDPSRVSASASVLCVVGHKEDELARSIALQMAALLNHTVTVVAGIHIDHASGDELRQLVTNSNCAVAQIIEQIKLSNA